MLHLFVKFHQNRRFGHLSLTKIQSADYKYINTPLSININADGVVTLPAIVNRSIVTNESAFFVDSARIKERKKERKKIKDSHKQTYRDGDSDLRRVHTRVWAQFKYNRMTPVGMSATPSLGAFKVLFVQENRETRQRSLVETKSKHSRNFFSRRSSIDRLDERTSAINTPLVYTLASQPVFARSVKQHGKFPRNFVAVGRVVRESFARLMHVICI